MSDPTTQSNYLEIVTEHVLFSWTVDFKTKIIEGSALHDLTVKKDDVREVMYVFFTLLDMPSLSTLLLALTQQIWTSAVSKFKEAL